VRTIIPAESCVLRLLLILPPDCFVDPFELALYGSSFQLSNFSNLEFPAHAISPNSSQLLIDAVLPDDLVDVSLSVEVPLHMRYPAPTRLSDFRRLNISGPAVFWDCRESKSMGRQKESMSLLDFKLPRLTTESRLQSIPCAHADTHSEMSVPVARADHAEEIEFLTVSAVSLAFVYLVLVMWIMNRVKT